MDHSIDRHNTESPAGSSSSSSKGPVFLSSAHSKQPSGSKKFRETRPPGKRDSGKWVCEVGEPTPTFKGRSASLNYADSSWHPASAETAEVYTMRKPKEERQSWIMDEDDVFRLPELLMNMAEGLMLPPPQDTVEGDDVDTGADFSLWHH